MAPDPRIEKTPDGRYTLLLDDQFTVNGRKCPSVELAGISGPTLDALARVCMARAAYLPLADRPSRMAVVAELNYSDHGGDQASPYYLWSVIVQGAELASRVAEATARELDRTAAFDCQSHVPYWPDEYENGRAALETVEAAIADLRATLLAHASDSVLHSISYWRESGFTDDEVAELSNHIYEGLFDDMDYGDDPAEFLETYLAEQDAVMLDLAATPLFLKLSRWILGHDLIVGQPDVVE